MTSLCRHLSAQEIVSWAQRLCNKRYLTTKGPIDQSTLHPKNEMCKIVRNFIASFGFFEYNFLGGTNWLRAYVAVAKTALCTLQCT